MKKFIKKRFISAIAAGYLAMPFATTSHAEEEVNDNYLYEGDGGEVFEYMPMTSSEVDGGYWIRGKISGNVHSQYKHYEMEARGSVVNGADVYTSGGWKPLDIFSTAKQTGHSLV